MARAAGPRVAVSVIVEHDAWQGAIAEPLPLLRRAARAAVAEVRRARRSRATWTPTVAVALMDDRAIRKLNKSYRGKDKPTNVLSFAALDGGKPPRNQAWPLGDIILALGTCRKEARTQRKSLEQHLAHLVIHGVLHLLGYDHEAEAEAERMEGLEIAALKRLGIDNPYVTM